jgi:hypothetical protein
MFVSALFAVLSLPCAVLHGQVTFSSHTYTLNNIPQFVVSGDLHGDGKPDLVLSSQNADTLSVLLNKGNGTFSPETDYNAIPNYFVAIAVGDFNGDRKLDVLAVDGGDVNSGTTAALYVLLGNGDGTLQAPVSTNLAFVVQLLAFVGVGDFDRDGKF